MSHEKNLASSAAFATGLDFQVASGETDGRRWIEMVPDDHSRSNTFAIRTTFGWRHLDIIFKPGSFAGELVSAMGGAGPQGRGVFLAVIRHSQAEGATPSLVLNGNEREFDDATIWGEKWNDVLIRLRVGQLEVNAGNTATENRLVKIWALRMAASVLALMPLEEKSSNPAPPEIEAFPEGAIIQMRVNRYERDPRNRAAAISIHGDTCKVCEVGLSELYGESAMGLVEVHHTTPVSEIGEQYIIDPATDLVPLCPNCHAVAHRRNPPFSVDELRQLRLDCTSIAAGTNGPDKS